MSSQKDENRKAATLKMHLDADSGYECRQEARISAEQWGRICAIVAEKDSVEESTQRPLTQDEKDGIGV